jgi:predicted dehydrogenase
VEKPVAATVKEAQEIIAAAKKKKLVLQVGHIERFNPVVSAVKNAMKGEKIISIDIIRVGPHPPRVKDVGVVVDIGTHDIDLIRYLSESDFERTYAVIASPKNKFEDAAVLSFKLKNGTIASVVTNRLTPFKVRELKVATENKLIHGNLLSQQVVEYRRYEPRETSYEAKNLYVPFAEPLKLELESFVDAVKNNRKPKVTGEDGLRALEVALKCLQKNR